jgi:chemotaxis signal transduction protein
VLGIVTWRGEFVTVLDTARVLALASGAAEKACYALVLRGSEPRIALAVDAFDGITRVDPAELQPPDQLRSARRDLFRGITRDAIVVLDENRFTQRLSEELRAA